MIETVSLEFGVDLVNVFNCYFFRLVVYDDAIFIVSFKKIYIHTNSRS